MPISPGSHRLSRCGAAWPPVTTSSAGPTAAYSTGIQAERAPVRPASRSSTSVMTTAKPPLAT